MTEKQESYLSFAIEPMPVGYQGVDELAARLGVEAGRGDYDIVIQGRSGKSYPLVPLLSAFIDLCNAVLAVKP